ncbi:MAG: enoyl-CoA hydratase-related protein [Pedococcus sp.]
MSDLVSVEVEAGIATILLNRPPMNALNAEVQGALSAAAIEVGQRRDVSGVILYGGEKVFAAGADIKEMQTMSYTDMADHSVALQDFTRTLSRIPKPTVAAITGYALGGGCEVALACDFRVAAKNAKLGQPEILLGIIPGAGGTQRLARLVGPARAKEIIFSGRFVSADEALAIGLVDEVVEAQDVYAAAQARLAPYVGGPAYAIRAAKEAIDRGVEVDLDTGLEIERMLFASLFATKDRATGMKSFVENGPGKAKFEGA